MKYNYNSVELSKRIAAKKKYPILILDEVYLRKFPQNYRTPKILHLENELKEKIKEEAKLTGHVKELKKTKNKTLNEILYYSKEIEDKNSNIEPKMQELQNKVLQINEQFEKLEQALYDIPEEIQKINKQLLEETVLICYDRMRKSEDEITQLIPKIESLRESLKDCVSKKNQLKEDYENTFYLLHDLVGQEIMDYLDDFGKGGKNDFRHRK